MSDAAEVEKPSIDVRIKAVAPSPSAAANRLASAAQNLRAAPAAEARSNTVLVGCEEAFHSLTRMHSTYLDVTDLDPTGHSRPAAIWLVSGRCLGLLRALLAQVRAGVMDEALVTDRAIHEAIQLLLLFSVPEDEQADDLVRAWLADEGEHGYIKQRDAREAQDRYENRLAEAMEAVGKLRLAPTWKAMKELYALKSRVVHSRRSSCLASYSAPLRQMVYGWHPSPTERASAADWAATVTGTVIGGVGDALRALYGSPRFFTEHVQPIQQRLDEICDAVAPAHTGAE